LRQGANELAATDRHNIQAAVTMLKLARSTKRRGARRAALLDVGVHLQWLRDAPGRNQDEWLWLVRNSVGIGKSRAYGIMALARKTLVGKTTAKPV
jgi:hypothetical protein